MTGTLNAAKGMTAVAGADSALHLYVFHHSFLFSEPKTWKMGSPYTGITLLIIAVPSKELRHSAHFANFGNKAVVNHIVLSVQGP